jgi:hypothetical protein
MQLRPLYILYICHYVHLNTYTCSQYTFFCRTWWLHCTRAGWSTLHACHPLCAKHPATTAPAGPWRCRCHTSPHAAAARCCPCATTATLCGCRFSSPHGPAYAAARCNRCVPIAARRHMASNVAWGVIRTGSISAECMPAMSTTAVSLPQTLGRSNRSPRPVPIPPKPK